MPIVLALAGVGFLLWAVSRAQGASDTSNVVPPTPLEVTPAGNVVGTGSALKEASDKEQAEFEGNVRKVVGAGAAIGGPVGAFVGFVGGTIVASFGREGFEPPSPAQVGVPFYKPEVSGDNLSLVLPEGPSNIRKLTFSVASLREMFPGDGAYEACLRSGMFQWRPYDQGTPFSQLLYANAPGLKDWEEKYIRETPDDFVHGENRSAILWKDLYKATIGKRTAFSDKEQYIFDRFLIQMRRAFAHHAIGNGAGVDGPGPLAGFWAIYLYNLRNEWDRKISLPGQEGLDHYLAVHVAISHFASITGAGIQYDRETKERVGELAPDVRKHRAINRGFAGAWRYAGRDTAGSTKLGNQVLSARPPDPEAAFKFEVFLPAFWGIRVVPSAWFVDIFGSHTGVYQALTEGRVAWSPTNDARVMARWDAKLTLGAAKPSLFAKKHLELT